MPKERILFLDQYPTLSGGQKVLLTIIKDLSSRGYRCLVALPEQGLLSARLKDLGVGLYFFPLGYYSITRKNPLDFLSYALRLPLLTYRIIKLIKKKRVSLVYANGARTFIWATLACQILKIPLIWHLHSIFDKGTIRKIFLYFGKYSAVKKVFAVSRVAADPLSGLGEKLEIIYNAAPLPIPLPKINLLREEYRLREGSFLIGSIGILEDWKNQQDLIRAAKLIKERVKREIYFFIIGDSLYKNLRKQSYKNKLKRLATELNLEKEVIFAGFRQDIAEIISALDILVICSKDPDPCPMVSLEAASMGKAIISTDAGGTKEIFTENKQALFYRARDHRQLAEKITYLYENRPALESLGKEAQLHVQHQCSLDDFLSRINYALRRAIDGE